VGRCAQHSSQYSQLLGLRPAAPCLTAYWWRDSPRLAAGIRGRTLHHNHVDISAENDRLWQCCRHQDVLPGLMLMRGCCCPQVKLKAARRARWEASLSSWRRLRTHHSIQRLAATIASPRFAEPPERLKVGMAGWRHWCRQWHYNVCLSYMSWTHVAHAMDTCRTLVHARDTCCTRPAATALACWQLQCAHASVQCTVWHTVITFAVHGLWAAGGWLSLVCCASSACVARAS
jgi:hypothetical protein